MFDERPLSGERIFRNFFGPLRSHLLATIFLRQEEANHSQTLHKINSNLPQSNLISLLVRLLAETLTEDAFPWISSERPLGTIRLLITKPHLDN